MAGNDNFTKLLLHLDEDFSDSSTSEIVPSANEYVAITHGDSKFKSTGCAGFNTIAWATGGVLTFPLDVNLVFGTSPFTLDFWAKDLFVDHSYCGFTFLAGAAEEVLFRLDTFDKVSTFKFAMVGDVSFVAAEWTAGITKTFVDIAPYYSTYTWSIFNPRAWNHFALCVGDGFAELFINGESQGNIVLADNSSNYDKPAVLSVYGDGWVSPHFQTLLDEYRLSIGIKRWTENFDPPTEPYSEHSDHKLTKLILSMNGNDESQIFIDSSAAPHTIISKGAVKQDTGWYQIGTASAQFDSSSDYLSIADDTHWEIFNAPFTIHFWFRPVNITEDQKIFGQYHGSLNTFMCCTYNHDYRLITFELMLNGFRKVYLQVTAALALNEFSHIAIVGK